MAVVTACMTSREAEGNRCRDLTGAHPAAESGRPMASVVPRSIRAGRKLDDLIERMNQGHS